MLQIDKQLTLQYNCDPFENATHTEFATIPANPALQAISLPQTESPYFITKSNTLIVMLSWLLAKENHIMKYRSLYFDHGFDVLTVKTKPYKFLIPPLGSQIIAGNLLNFLRKNVPNTYSNVIIHSFSIGAYLFGEFLVHLEREMRKRPDDESVLMLRDSIKGIIYDSAVTVDVACQGFSKAIAGNNWATPILRPLLSSYLSTHMKVCYPFATRHYLNAEDAILRCPIPCPILILGSTDDDYCDMGLQHATYAQWKDKGVPVKFKCWNQSLHVAHYFKHPQEYRSEINKFVGEINLEKQ